MILRNLRYLDLVRTVKENKNRIVIYGAGMIGQIVVPYIVDYYGLHEYIECYVDMDERKIGQTMQMGSNQYEIRHPEFLLNKMENLVILVTNSKFYSVIDYLDGMENLADVEVYIIPVMQIKELDYAVPISIKKISNEPLIPRKIHYCWFGGNDMPEFLTNCIENWKRYCPDYEIIEWNENNYDVTKFPYAKEAYESKKYGFVTDIARLDILNEHGGIYMDTDVMLLQPLDILLYQEAFVGVEKWGNINTGGLVGAVPGHPMIKEMLEYRKQFHFVKADGSLNIETNGVYETVPFIKHGMKIDNTMQSINEMTVYPSSVFHPYDYMSGEDRIEDWTFSKHYFYGGWMEKSDIDNRSNTQSKYKQILERMKK